MELRGFEPLTFCMPCRRATSCAIAPQLHPSGGTELAYRFLARVSYATKTRPRHGQGTAIGAARQPTPVTLIPVSTQGPDSTQQAENDSHLRTPAGKPRARSLGLRFRGTPGPQNAITDVPGIEVGYQTLIQGDNVRTGVTAIHPRGKANPGDSVAAGFHSQNGNGEMTGVSWIGAVAAHDRHGRVPAFVVLRRPDRRPRGHIHHRTASRRIGGCGSARRQIGASLPP